MRVRAPRSPSSPLLWFAVAGAPLAWTLQFALGYWLTQAECSEAGSEWGIALSTWAVAATAVAATVALAAGFTAVALLRATAEQETEGAPPLGRTRFLSIVGIAITPLFLAIIVMNGVGIAVLSSCHQG
jgi:heme/copper-type cytochrome/quinol oxidase subunit 2